jgi:hypothetical protein
LNGLRWRRHKNVALSCDTHFQKILWAKAYEIQPFSLSYTAQWVSRTSSKLPLIRISCGLSLVVKLLLRTEAYIHQSLAYKLATEEANNFAKHNISHKSSAESDPLGSPRVVETDGWTCVSFECIVHCTESQESNNNSVNVVQLMAGVSFAPCVAMNLAQIVGVS